MLSETKLGNSFFFPKNELLAVWYPEKSAEMFLKLLCFTCSSTPTLFLNPFSLLLIEKHTIRF